MLYESWAPGVRPRKNVLLLVDHEGDIRMADGERHDTMLSVGFLNGELSHLESHRKTFDAVVLEDEGMDLPNQVLEAITK